jgi:cysteinyl-tRNA synthetase
VVFRLYDTRAGQVEAIEPARRGLLRMYSCGPSGYRRAHVGDLRSYLLGDLIRRNAEYRHHLMVLTCQSISDAGIRAGQSATAGLAGDDGEDGEDAFRADCSALNLRPAENSPRASASIGLITDMIARLIEAGHAHPEPGGSVYFDAESFPGFGELSGAELSGGEKRPRADWVLWTGAADGRELTGPAPWSGAGPGFPARPAECSALSLRDLGDVIDIHTGGIDLLYPHHEQERAQSNAVTGHEAVRHWVHGERTLFDGRALTGSAAAAVFLADLADRGLDPLALRLGFLEHRYREQADLSWDTLAAADRALHRWRELVAEWACSPSKPMCAQVTAQIAAAFDDDLDTPAALRALRLLEQDPEIPAGSKFESFAHADQLLGLDLARDIGRAPAAPPPASARNESSA